MTIRMVLIAIVSCLSFTGPCRADTVDIQEWLVPWEGTLPRDPFVAGDGKVWFAGQTGDYIANLFPQTGDFSRYDLKPRTGPHNLIVDADDMIWFAANRGGYIGVLNPDTGRVVEIEMPDNDAEDPHTLAFGAAGTIWFTVQQGNFIGRLSMDDHAVQLMRVPTDDARPYGIVVNANGIPWVAEFGSNKLIRINPETMSLEEIVLPNEDSRPRRLVVTSDNSVWYGDYALGVLGRYDPGSGEFSSWPLPSGEDSRPYGMAVDKFDRIWLVETGVSPNRFVGFDTASETFVSETAIPSGAGNVRNMFYFEPAGEIWFGTDTNYVGRAKVH